MTGTYQAKVGKLALAYGQKYRFWTFISPEVSNEVESHMNG